MITPKDMERLSNNKVVVMYQKLNEDLSKTIINKIRSAGDVSSYTRSQIRTLELQGGHDVFLKALMKTQNLSAKAKREIIKIFEEVGETELKGYRKIYYSRKLDYKLSAESIQLIKTIAKRTNNTMKNMAKTIAYKTQRQYVEAMDDLYKKVVTGAYDYNTAMRQTERQLAKEGITLKNKDGSKTRIEVAVRRNLLTSIHQTAQSIAKDIGDTIGANCVVIGHSNKCRPTHHVIDAVTMSIPLFKQYEYLTEEANCYHIVNYDWQPQFEKTKSKVEYLDDHVSYKEAVANYKVQQKARYYERQVREAKRTIASGDSTKEERKNLRNAQARLRIYNRQNNIEQDYFRTWTPGYNK
jgi:hypothetical protein